jgi:hypothetical protein
LFGPPLVLHFAILVDAGVCDAVPGPGQSVAAWVVGRVRCIPHAAQTSRAAAQWRYLFAGRLEVWGADLSTMLRVEGVCAFETWTKTHRAKGFTDGAIFRSHTVSCLDCRSVKSQRHHPASQPVRSIMESQETAQQGWFNGSSLGYCTGTG